MLLLENKYDLFKKITFDKISSQYENKLKAYDQELSEKILKYEEEVKEKKEKNILKEKHKIDIKTNEEIQIMKNSSRETILKLREDIIEDLVESLIEKFKLFTNSKEYFQKLEIEIGKYIENEDNIIYISDMDRKKLVSEGIKGKFETLENKEIGGFKIVNRKENNILNNTIKNIIDSNRNSIGLVVQEFINEVGAEIE